MQTAYTPQGTHVYGKSVEDRKSTRLNSSHHGISYAVFCLKKTSSVTRVGLGARSKPLSCVAASARSRPPEVIHASHPPPSTPQHHFHSCIRTLFFKDEGHPGHLHPSPPRHPLV